MPHLSFKSKRYGLRLVYFLPPHSLCNFEEDSEAFSLNTHLIGGLKETTSTFLPLKRVRVTTSNPILTTSKASWPRSPTAVRMCHTLLSKIYYSRDAIRVSGIYTRGEYATRIYAKSQYKKNTIYTKISALNIMKGFSWY